MQKKYSHFLLTRFNLHLWKQDKNGEQTHTDMWLAERFRLFEKYCLPSIAAQTCKNFCWMVLFDSDTPEAYRQQIDTYVKICPQFTSFFLTADQAPNYLSFYNANIKQLIADDCRYVITTRLDNDDALNVNYIERIQQAVEQQNKVREYFLSFSWGLQYFEEWNFAVRIKYPNNHFISLVQPAMQKLKNVYETPHLQFRQYGSVLNISNKDNAWMEVIHDHNASNDIKIKNLQYPLWRRKILQDFSSDITISCFSAIYRFLFSFIPQCIRHTWEHNRFWGYKTNEVK